MKAVFRQDKQNLIVGMTHYLWTMHKAVMLLPLILAGLFYVVAIVELFNDRPFWLAVIVLFLVATFIAYSALNRSKKIVNRYERGYFAFGEYAFECLENKAIVTGPLSRCEIDYAMFVGYSLAKDGMLIYPQMQEFYWISKDSDFAVQ